MDKEKIINKFPPMPEAFQPFMKDLQKCMERATEEQLNVLFVSLLLEKLSRDGKEEVLQTMKYNQAEKWFGGTK